MNITQAIKVEKVLEELATTEPALSVRDVLEALRSVNKKGVFKGYFNSEIHSMDVYSDIGDDIL